MTDTAISPLRRRMIDDMTIRHLAPNIQRGYLRAVKNFADFLGHSPDRATIEDIPPLSAEPRVERPRHSQRERHHDGAALLLQGHLAKRQRYRRHRVHPRASAAAGCLSPEEVARLLPRRRASSTGRL